LLAYIGTLSFAPTHEAKPSVKAKEPILPTLYNFVNNFLMTNFVSFYFVIIFVTDLVI